MNKRLAWSLVAYAALAAIAAFVLHGKVLWVVLILYGYFAVRTFIADKMRSQQESDRDESFQSETSNPDSESESGNR
jgi:hypothetical protein